MLAATLAGTQPTAFALRGFSEDEGWFSFETGVGRGVGHLRMRNGKAWTLLTTLQELKGFEEKRLSSHESISSQDDSPYVVIIGGGQGGIALAARLKRLNVPAVVLEKNERAGDSWRKRYKSLVLHDPVWYDHLPYIPFPEHWPAFSPKDRIADWLEAYVRAMDLDYWTSAKCVSATYFENEGFWLVRVNRGGQEITLKPKHLVLATGMSGMPHIPRIPGADFKGRMVHSSQFGGGAQWHGKQCAVVGSGTSAHDICADLHESGAASVTMVQRAPSIVVRSESLMELAWGPLYSEQAVASGISTEIADLTVASIPHKVLPALQVPVYSEILKRDAAFYDALGKAGFQFHFGEDGSGIHTLYLRRGAGYYIEVGASQMIIEGKIKLKSGSVERINERSLTLSDGADLPADLVVFATGYGSMNGWAAQLISQEVADKVGKVWGLGSDTKNDPGPWVGELRNMWKPTQQPGLWFHGGNLMQSRHYSLYLALQLKARMENIPTPVFFIDPGAPPAIIRGQSTISARESPTAILPKSYSDPELLRFARGPRPRCAPAPRGHHRRLRRRPHDAYLAKPAVVHPRRRRGRGPERVIHFPLGSVLHQHDLALERAAAERRTGRAARAEHRAAGADRPAGDAVERRDEPQSLPRFDLLPLLRNVDGLAPVLRRGEALHHGGVALHHGAVVQRIHRLRIGELGRRRRGQRRCRGPRRRRRAVGRLPVHVMHLPGPGLLQQHHLAGHERVGGKRAAPSGQLEHRALVRDRLVDYAIGGRERLRALEIRLRLRRRFRAAGLLAGRQARHGVEVVAQQRAVEFRVHRLRIVRRNHRPGRGDKNPTPYVYVSAHGVSLAARAPGSAGTTPGTPTHPSPRTRSAAARASSPPSSRSSCPSGCGSRGAAPRDSAPPTA